MDKNNRLRPTVARRNPRHSGAGVMRNQEIMHYAEELTAIWETEGLRILSTSTQNNIDPHRWLHTQENYRT